MSARHCSTCRCAEDPRNDRGRVDSHAWRRARYGGPSAQVPVRVIVTPDRAVRMVVVGGHDYEGQRIGTVVDASTIEAGHWTWVAAPEGSGCDGWHITGTNAWGACRRGEHTACYYGVTELLHAAAHDIDLRR